MAELAPMGGGRNRLFLGCVGVLGVLFIAGVLLVGWAVLFRPKPVIQAVPTRSIEIVEVLATNTPTPVATPTFNMTPVRTEVIATRPPMPTIAPTAKTNTAPNGTTLKVAAISSTQQGNWAIQYFGGATEEMKKWKFNNPQSGWEKFPDSDWPASGFVAAHGLEHGQALSVFCQQDRYCDWPVAPKSFRSITADYKVDGIGECSEGGTRIGCALIFVNVGNVTASYRSQKADTGHTITGLYWHGGFLNEAISALSSHLAYRMIGLTREKPANPGGNCSSPNGCQGVNIVFVITSGNEPLVLGRTVFRP